MKSADIIRNNVVRMSEFDLGYFYDRVSNNFQRDIEEISLRLESHYELDRCFQNAKSHDDFFSLLDVLKREVEKETKRRYSTK